MSNLFELATRKKYRFPSENGNLSVEQLWDLPLTRSGRQTTDLDSIAQTIAGELEKLITRSFVQITPDPRRGELTNKLEILKTIIATKLAEAEATKRRMIKAEERKKIIDAIGSAEQRELSALSKAELEKRLSALDD
jgi:hypothetical protein